MAKLPVVLAKDLVRVAEAVGFVFDRQKGSHAVYVRMRDRPRIVIPMHGGKDLKPGTLRGTLGDMEVTPSLRDGCNSTEVGS